MFTVSPPGNRVSRGSLLCVLKNIRHGIVLMALLMWCTVRATSAAAQAEPAEQLTIERALILAQSHSYSLLAQDAAARSAREKAVSAGRLPDPVLQLSASNIPAEGDFRYSLNDDFMTMRSVGLMQTYVSSEKRQIQTRRYHYEAEAALSLKSLQQARLNTATAIAWFNLHYQQQLVNLLQKQRQDTQRMISAVDMAYSSGKAELADTLIAREALFNIDDQLEQSRVSVVNADQQLTRWIGLPHRPRLGPPPTISHLVASSHDMQHRLNQHPIFAVLAAQERLAQTEVSVAQLEKDPDWTWSVMYSKRADRFGDMVSVGVSIPLQWDHAHRQNREITAQVYKVEQVQAERSEQYHSYLSELNTLHSNWSSNLQRLRNYDENLFPLLKQRIQATEASFSSGKVQLSEVIAAHQVALDSRIEYLAIENQTAIWWAELSYLYASQSQDQRTASALSAAKGTTP